MEIKAIYTRVKEYIEYKKIVFEDLRATEYISNKEIICVCAFILFVAGFIIFWIVDSRQMEREYQKKVEEINRHYREKQKELNIDTHPSGKMPDDFETLEDWIMWQIENDMDRPR